MRLQSITFDPQRFFWLLQEINKRIQDVAFDGVKDGGALVINILIFDLRVQLQYCTYQRKTLLFALIKVSTFICKREFSGFSSPLIEYQQRLALRSHN